MWSIEAVSFDSWFITLISVFDPAFSLSTQNASLNCSTSMSSSSSSHPSIQLAEPVVLEPFNHQVSEILSKLRNEGMLVLRSTLFTLQLS